MRQTILRATVLALVLLATTLAPAVAQVAANTVETLQAAPAPTSTAPTQSSVFTIPGSTCPKGSTASSAGKPGYITCTVADTAAADPALLANLGILAMIGTDCSSDGAMTTALDTWMHRITSPGITIGANSYSLGKAMWWTFFTLYLVFWVVRAVNQASDFFDLFKSASTALGFPIFVFALMTLASGNYAGGGHDFISTQVEHGGAAIASKLDPNDLTQDPNATVGPTAHIVGTGICRAWKIVSLPTAATVEAMPLANGTSWNPVSQIKTAAGNSVSVIVWLGMFLLSIVPAVIAILAHLLLAGQAFFLQLNAELLAPAAIFTLAMSVFPIFKDRVGSYVSLLMTILFQQIAILLSMYLINSLFKMVDDAIVTAISNGNLGGIIMFQLEMLAISILCLGLAFAAPSIAKIFNGQLADLGTGVMAAGGILGALGLGLASASLGALKGTAAAMKTKDMSATKIGGAKEAPVPENGAPLAPPPGNPSINEQDAPPASAPAHESRGDRTADAPTRASTESVILDTDDTAPRASSDHPRVGEPPEESAGPSPHDATASPASPIDSDPAADQDRPSSDADPAVAPRADAADAAIEPHSLTPVKPGQNGTKIQRRAGGSSTSSQRGAVDPPNPRAARTEASTAPATAPTPAAAAEEPRTLAVARLDDAVSAFAEASTGATRSELLSASSKGASAPRRATMSAIVAAADAVASIPAEDASQTHLHTANAALGAAAIAVNNGDYHAARQSLRTATRATSAAALHTSASGPTTTRSIAHATSAIGVATAALGSDAASVSTRTTSAAPAAPAHVEQARAAAIRINTTQPTTRPASVPSHDTTVAEGSPPPTQVASQPPADLPSSPPPTTVSDHSSPTPSKIALDTSSLEAAIGKLVAQQANHTQKLQNQHEFSKAMERRRKIEQHRRTFFDAMAGNPHIGIHHNIIHPGEKER